MAFVSATTSVGERLTPQDAATAGEPPGGRQGRRRPAQVQA